MTVLLHGLANQLMASWPSALQRYSSAVASALADTCSRVLDHLKPTPMKVQYTFSWRDAAKVLLGMSMVGGTMMRRQAEVLKLFYHECYRTFGDRLLMAHDRTWFMQMLEEVCRKHFKVIPPGARPETGQDSHELSPEEGEPRRAPRFSWPIADPEALHYSRWNPEVEGVYSEVTDLAESAKLIESTLERHNDSNERARLDLIVFSRLARDVLKVTRALAVPGGHLVIISMKGFGMTSVVRLCAHTLGQHLRELDVSQGLLREDWHTELRRAILAAGEEGRAMTLFTDQYQMVDDAMYSDLELLLRNHMNTEIVDKETLDEALASLNQRLVASDGADGDDQDAFEEEDLTPDELAAKERLKGEQEAAARADNEKLMRRWPHLRVQLYRTFLERVRDHFHLVHQFSPTGSTFRERLSRQKDLLNLSQVMIVTDLKAAELTALGQGFFAWEREKARLKAQAAGSNVPKALVYTVSSDSDSRARVLKCIGRMYLQAVEAATQFAEEEGQVLYFTPALYLRVFVCYRKLLKERQAIVKDISTRYEAGLDQIKLTQDTIYKFHRELADRAPMLQQECEEAGGVLEQIEAEFARVTAQREQLRREVQEAALQEEEARVIKEECEETLNRIIPSLNAAMNAGDVPSKKELADLRALKKPPEIVKLVMQATCMLLGVQPAPEKDRVTGKMVMSWWAAATGKEVLGNPRLPEMLMSFDRNKLTPEIMMEVEAVLTEGGYTYEAATAAFSSASGIFKWIKATREYFYIFKEIEPRRDAFMMAEKQYE